jgi:hypothetical protein
MWAGGKRVRPQTHDPQPSHHALLISIPLIPFTVYTLGAGPSMLVSALSAKICAEYLHFSTPPLLESRFEVH